MKWEYIEEDSEGNINSFCAKDELNGILVEIAWQLNRIANNLEKIEKK